MIITEIAKALIDIHNALPSASADVMAAMPEDDNEYEYLMEQYSNLLVTLWDIMHRLDGVDLEAVALRQAQDATSPADSAASLTEGAE